MAQNLSNLPIGAKVKFGKHSINGETAQDIIWLVVAKNHAGYPSNSITLQAASIIDLRCFDAAESTNPNTERVSGNNRYSISNIDQWLNDNGAAGYWYEPQHTYDAPPNQSGGAMDAGTKYADRPGFLYHMTNEERSSILSTTIRVVKPSVDGGGYDDIVRNVFLPSVTELGLGNENNIAEGSTWSYYDGNTAGRISYITSQVYNYTQYTGRPTVSMATNWWTRTPSSTGAMFVRTVSQYGSLTNFQAYTGMNGIRPALNLSSTLSISDTTDSDGCYTFNWNSAPPVPTTLNVPTVYGGKSISVSWTKVTDPDGNAVTYQLERSIDNGEFTTIYTGTNLAYSTIVPFGTTNVQFRLKATDSLGASSVYITSTNRTVVNNSAPVISGSDSNLGTKNSGFSQTYTITDADASTVTVIEAIDDVQVRSYVATPGNTNTFSVTGNTWLALANGVHTMTITVTDGVDSAVRTYTFTKSVSSFTIENTTAMVASTRPTRIKVSVTKNIPAAATFKIEVCNNGLDTSPTWEDATSSMNSGLVYLFTNTTKTATNWGVKIRVTVNRNGGTGACYVSSIGGNFE